MIAVAGGPRKAAVCREQGADMAIDYLADDVATAVADGTGDAGVDVVLDQMGGPLGDRRTIGKVVVDLGA